MSSRPRFRQMMTRPLARGVWVGYYNQLIQLGLQLLGVPILIGAWGAHDYGMWLILSAIPAYFVMSDFGMTTAATNDMLANATRGEIDKVVRVYQSLRLLVLMSCGTILAVAALLLALFGTQWLAFAAQATGGRASLTMLLLVAYGLLTIANGLLDAGFRAADRFATGRLVLATNSLIESVLMFTAVLLGAGLFHAALILLLARVAGSIAGLFLLKLKVPWLAKVSWQLDFTEIKRLSEPALASMAFPVANALIYQGSTIVIGAALSPAMVPIFSTARTLTRVALQILTVVSVASLQRFTIAYAARDEHKMDRLILLNLAIVLFVLLPAAGVAAVFGRWIIAIWTHGKVHTPYLVLYLLAAGMGVGGDVQFCHCHQSAIDDLLFLPLRHQLRLCARLCAEPDVRHCRYGDEFADGRYHAGLLDHPNRDAAGADQCRPTGGNSAGRSRRHQGDDRRAFGCTMTRKRSIRAAVAAAARVGRPGISRIRASLICRAGGLDVRYSP